MKALALDTSTSCISITSINGEKKATLILDIGMRQSEKLIPAIDYVLQQTDTNSAELNFTALCSGPGSFTGLRLGFSALKALQLAYSYPIYGVSTLQALLYPFQNANKTVLAVIDAKKKRFYASLYRRNQAVVENVDISAEKIIELIDSEEEVHIVGQDKQLFIEQLLTVRPQQIFNCQNNTQVPVSEIVYHIAAGMHYRKEKPLEQYEGPVYVRKSEAEESKLDESK